MTPSHTLRGPRRATPPDWWVRQHLATVRRQNRGTQLARIRAHAAQGTRGRVMRRKTA